MAHSSRRNRRVTSRDTPKSTDFGFEQVPWTEKAQRVRGVFDSVAGNYDLMNDLMSAGAHRLWKRFTLGMTGLRPGQRALDVAGGSGDLAAGMAAQVGNEGLIVLTDINAAMLEQGRDRMLDEGRIANSCVLQADAEQLPFADSSFNCVTIGFGLRNVTDKPAALASMRRVLKPGGRLLVLEFSQLAEPLLRPLYDAYSFRVLPLLGRIIARDADSYRYLAESIRKHPDQETLLGMMRDAGLEDCDYHNLSRGVVAVHRGYRY
jgi:demethylmenaquinone methyltransferase/2-methoxy-6-polyprenyl-1,4-benzoquinol methylase